MALESECLLHEYFHKAKIALIGSLQRDGVSLDEATEEASSYISPPSGKPVSKRDSNRLLDALGRASVPDSFMRLLLLGEIQESSVWDIDCRSTGVSGEGDSYVNFVIEETLGIRDLFSEQSNGIAVGVSYDGSWIWIKPDGSVHLLDHESGKLDVVGSSLRDFLRVNAELAVLYYGSLNWTEVDHPSFENIVDIIDATGVEEDWIVRSLAGRPRPV